MAKAQGLMGNLSELSQEWIKKEYGGFLTDGERVLAGFERLRDCVIFTDKRIINVDRRGVLGKKVRITSVYTSQIVGVAMETAGAGFNDHKLHVCYVATLYKRTAAGVKTAELRYEFPKKFDCKPLYRWLQKLAMDNYELINR